MCRKRYLWVSSEHFDTGIQFFNSDFLTGNDISAIWRRFLLIFAFDMLNVHHKRGPRRWTNVIHEAILDFTITKYGDDQIHDFIRFLDPQSLCKDTKIISLTHFLEELWMILWYGGHLGRHLEFHPFCLWSRLSTQVFLYLPRGVLQGSRVKLRAHLIAWLHTGPRSSAPGLIGRKGLEKEVEKDWKGEGEMGRGRKGREGRDGRTTDPMGQGPRFARLESPIQITWSVENVHYKAQHSHEWTNGNCHVWYCFDGYIKKIFYLVITPHRNDSANVYIHKT